MVKWDIETAKVGLCIFLQLSKLPNIFCLKYLTNKHYDFAQIINISHRHLQSAHRVFMHINYIQNHCSTVWIIYMFADLGTQVKENVKHQHV